MNLKKTLAILIAALMLLAIGCGKKDEPASSADASFTVTDMAGREVKFEKPV